MAKGAYIGIDNKARKIKKGYVGVLTDAIEAGEATITPANISTYFKVEDGSVKFTGSGSTFTATEHEAYIKLTALFPFNVNLDFTAHAFNAAYETFTVSVKGAQVWQRECDDGYPASSSWSGTLTTGDTVEFELSDAGRTYTGDGIKATFSVKTIVPEAIPAKAVARKIKKAYIGIGGVARPCWSGGELAYYGTITELNVARQKLAATAVGSYALFAGGSNVYGDPNAGVDAYDASLSRSKATVLSVGRYDLAATTIGNYALFGGGRNSSSGTKSTVESYDTSLTRATRGILQNSVHSLAATTVGNYALFSGGAYKSTTAKDNTTHYDTSCTSGYISGLLTARYKLAATTVGNYALFGGGQSGSNYYATVDTYNASLTHHITTDLSVARCALAATTVGNYALFGGGADISNGDVVDAYDASLTKITAPSLGHKRGNFAATTVGEYAVFGGSSFNSGFAYTDADVYDASLTKTTISNAMSPCRHGLAATAVGNYALFGGGVQWDGTGESTVNAFTVA